MTSHEESLRSHFTARFLTLLTGPPRRLRRDIPLVALHDRRKRCHKHHKDAYDRTGEEAIQEIGEHSVQRAAEYKNVIGQIEVHKKLSQSCVPRFVYVKSVFKYITPDDARYAYKFLRPLSRFSIRPRRLCQGKKNISRLLRIVSPATGVRFDTWGKHVRWRILRLLASFYFHLWITGAGFDESMTSMNYLVHFEGAAKAVLPSFHPLVSLYI